MSKYVVSADDADKISKFGIDLALYGAVTPEMDISRISVKEGHFEEFKHKSWFVYYVIEGSGVYVLNDQKIEVEQGDVISIPPNTRIHYFGNMELLLIVNPPWQEAHETHIRDIDKSENPL